MYAGTKEHERVCVCVCVCVWDLDICLCINTLGAGPVRYMCSQRCCHLARIHRCVLIAAEVHRCSVPSSLLLLQNTTGRCN